MMKTSADSYKIIEEFCCRMTGTMKEWYHNLGTFKQDELHRLETTTNILGVLHREFIVLRIPISHGKFKRPEVGESSTQATQQNPDSPMEAEFSEGQVEEANRKLMDHTYMMDAIWQHESSCYGDCISDENLSDQNMSPSHEPIFKD
ncbi:hypothetical protein KIW84_056374 [Lathyrus oleraceus]|uniref:Polyprotein n=1 Tax=Pisum sativum TaxID=3888 RepID=A0A9D5AMH0_PEA|nr:hypothetical protein KIW84_056374 [Pisum sativum]